MLMDADILRFLQNLQTSHPLPPDPNDLVAFLQRYEAVSQALPGPPEPLRVSVGGFHVNVLACGEKSRIDARLYLPEGIKTPVLMAFFHGGGWVAGSLSSHDAFCRQLSIDLQVAVASVHVPLQPGQAFVLASEQALQVLVTLGKVRERLGANPTRLLVAGDGSGAHLGLQAAWRLARQLPGSVDAVLALTPLVKPDFNTASYIRNANSLTFSRDDAVRSWHSLLGGRWETWDERAVLLHGNQPIQRPPLVVVVAAEHDVAHDDAAALHDWLKEAGARCEFYGAPGMPHDFARLQHSSRAARHLMLSVLDAFARHAGLRVA
ncbi:MAG: alpha/beta hydrolase [Pseudomonadota bacterium]